MKNPLNAAISDLSVRLLFSSPAIAYVTLDLEEDTYVATGMTINGLDFTLWGEQESGLLHQNGYNSYVHFQLMWEIYHAAILDGMEESKSLATRGIHSAIAHMFYMTCDYHFSGHNKK